MELLKVFVGDGINSSLTATVGNMIKGDLLLLKASNYEPWVSADGNVPVVIAAKNDKGVYFSAPIANSNVVYCNYKVNAPYTPKVVTFALGESSYTAGSTYSLGVQIKEDLRMGTYNKNTEIIASHTCPSTTTSTELEVASTLAKGFAANPLTSAGSPYQLVKVVRTGSGGTAAAMGSTTTVVQGAREVKTATAHGRSVGQTVNLGGNVYMIETITSTTSFSLDTAYQGPSASLTSSATPGTSAAAYYSITTGLEISFVFTAIAQTQQNRYDQFRVVEFDVIFPKGWTGTTSVPVVTTATAYPSGSYRQVRDLEEKAHTNSMPLINYREFPFEVFPLNADPAKNNYDVLTITYNLPAGYNYMQSSSKEFPQTVVVCAPTPATGGDQFELDVVNTFINKFDTWFTGTVSGDSFIAI